MLRAVFCAGSGGSVRRAGGGSPPRRPRRNVPETARNCGKAGAKPRAGPSRSAPPSSSRAWARAAREPP
eukprot:5751714-Alexandrium_andersonii.AAC.1